ncbi:unnamed protein product [Blepharisma stoltei]|uniref:Uncharacterized protein n=1 Tax=Blepharisma stoltei TaxID=1481888 RepID=A0AAU9JDK0_9CILI|nr:unnamed protein product [Blepharisma stoltei]
MKWIFQIAKYLYWKNGSINNFFGLSKGPLSKLWTILYFALSQLGTSMINFKKWIIIIHANILDEFWNFLIWIYPSNRTYFCNNMTILN